MSNDTGTDFQEFTLASLPFTGQGWQPETRIEREAAHWFREIVHAYHGIIPWGAMPARALVAVENFGGREAMALVDAETVMMARQAFAKLYCGPPEDDSAEADPNDIPEDFKMAQAGDTDA